MFKHKAGFTLAEMLIVVMIAAAVVIWAIPSFKKAQSRARFDAARGFLIDLGNAVQSFREDLYNSGASNPYFPIGTSAIQLQAGHVVAANYDLSDIQTYAGNDENLIKAMFGLDYLPYIAVTGSGTNTTYKGYKFYICPDAAKNSTPSPCCAKAGDAFAVACMYDSTADAKYQKARYLEDSSVRLN